MSEILISDDAQELAKQFLRVIEENALEITEDLMLAWFANAIEVAKDRLTVKQLTDRAISRAQMQRIIHHRESGSEDGGREFSVAITKLEEAQMWFTRGMAIATGKFNPADLERDGG